MYACFSPPTLVLMNVINKEELQVRYKVEDDNVMFQYFLGSCFEKQKVSVGLTSIRCFKVCVGELG
jgi:hypothetical protein